MDTGQEFFGSWLEGLIYDRGYNKRTLARLLGVTPGTITHWTNGDTEPNATHISLLADLLGISRYELYLRLGRLDRYTQLDLSWEVLLQELSGTSEEYRAAVRRALEAMNDLWYRRSRRHHFVFEINLKAATETRGEVLRSGGEAPDAERLLYFGPVHSRDDKGWLMITGEVNEQLSSITIRGEHTSERKLLGVAFRSQTGKMEGAVQGTTFHFTELPLKELPDVTLLHLEFEPSGQ